MDQYIDKYIIAGLTDSHSNVHWEDIDGIPPADVRENVRGEWIEHKYAEEYDGRLQSNFECNKCHDWLRERTNYCPTCGAYMKSDASDVKTEQSSMLVCTKDGECYDELPMTEIDFSPDDNTYKEYLEEWEDIMSGDSFYNPDYILNIYGTKEEYARRMSAFSAYAILTPEDEWVEPGKMGWFGISDASSEEKKKKYEEKYMDIINRYMSDEYIMTIVDCHI